MGPNRSERNRRLATLALVVSVLGMGPMGRASAQGVRDYNRPILVVDNAGHHAPVRRLEWRDARTLLSAGMDKVVKVWDLSGRPGLAKTIRPPIWRGARGVIYASALSPAVDARGQSLLAVAGMGVDNFGGDITVFRFPGLAPLGTGEPVARLLSTDPKVPRRIGHADTVMSLAFDRSGAWLASGSNDGTAILWFREGEKLRPVHVLRGHAPNAPVNAVAFTSDGKRLVTGGADKRVLVWDVALGRQAVAGVVLDSAVTTLAVSPSGSLALVGTERGALWRLDPANPGRAVQLATRAGRGPVEHVAINSEGTRCVVSTVSDGGIMNDVNRVSCDVEVLTLPNGGPTTFKRTLNGLVYAAAFSPDRKSLAYAGGPSQAIYVEDLTRTTDPVLVLAGTGTTLHDVGFSADSRVVGFARAVNDAAGPTRPFDGFDLSARTIQPIAEGALNGAVKAYLGWRVELATSAHRLRVVNADGRRFDVDLDQKTERRWWSFSFIPPGTGHPRATFAVGAEAGVIFFDLDTGRRTRFFAGHGGPVTTLAPSPDGRWLATGSNDQTLMLWTLAGSDAFPALGASFRRTPEGWLIAEVAPNGFAEGMGLHADDLIVEAGLGNDEHFVDPEEIARFVAKVGSTPLGAPIALIVRRRIHVPLYGSVELTLDPVNTTRRDSPALTIMTGIDREWVAWTPRGYYDTSIEGDLSLLGWQTNPRYDRVGPTDYVPIAAHEAAMRRPRVLDALFATADPVQASAGLAPGEQTPDQVAENDQPPRIEVAALDLGASPPRPGAPVVTSRPDPRVSVSISARGKSRIAERRITVSGVPIVHDPLPAPVAELNEVVPVTLPPNQVVRLVVETANVGGGRRSEALDLEYRPQRLTPSIERASPRVMIVSLGAERFRSRSLPPIRFAERDADALADFFARHALPPEGEPAATGKGEESVLLVGDTATTSGVMTSLERLSSAVGSKELKKGDMIIISVVSHMLMFENSARLAGADTGAGSPPEPMIPADDLSARLESLVGAGVRVVLFLDVVHEPLEAPIKADVKSWVRDLQRNRGVVAFIASKEGSGGVSAGVRHGLFASGILNAFDAGGATGARKDRAADYSLADFKAAVVQNVSTASDRRQEVGGYFPLSIPATARFARPKGR